MPSHCTDDRITGFILGAAAGLSPGVLALTSVSPSSVGTLWGQPWGQPWTAIYRADEEDSIVTALMSIFNAPDRMDILAALLQRCLGAVPPLSGLVTWEQALGSTGTNCASSLNNVC